MNSANNTCDVCFSVFVPSHLTLRFESKVCTGVGEVTRASEMTSFIISAHLDRFSAPSWEHNADCPFCRIIKGELDAFRVYEDANVIAILGALAVASGLTPSSAYVERYGKIFYLSAQAIRS